MNIIVGIVSHIWGLGKALEPTWSQLFIELVKREGLMTRNIFSTFAVRGASFYPAPVEADSFA